MRAGEGRPPGTIWIVTDGSVGMEAQGIAVAEAIRWLPARLQIYLPLARLLGSVAANEPLGVPWPRLIISIGRRSVPIALAIKRSANAFALHIQNPKVPVHHFNLIAAPLHDGFSGDNVLNTFGAVHSVTRVRLAEAAKSFASRIQALPGPRLAVLMGGESQASSFPPKDATAFGASLARVARDSGGSLLVTPSRRISPEALRALSAAIAGVPHLVWENPLFRLPGHGRRHRQHRGFGQHGHRGRRHRQAGLCAIPQGQIEAPQALPRADAGARRDPPLRGTARVLVLYADQRHGTGRERHPASPRS